MTEFRLIPSVIVTFDVFSLQAITSTSIVVKAVLSVTVEAVIVKVMILSIDVSTILVRHESIVEQSS